MSSFALAAPQPPIAGEGVARAVSPSRNWRLSAATGTRWAVAVAIFMSTQYLFQPFVWEYWPADEVLLGWLEVVADRALVALSIALALIVATRVPVRTLGARTSLIAVAIVGGAAAGEAVLLAVGSTGARDDLAALSGRVAQWTGLALCISGMYYLWVSNNEARAAARADELRRSTTEALIVQTQLQALRQQIDPHFLFNTLATIRRLNETEATDGASLLRHLLDYLRSTMPTSGYCTTLGDEVDLVRSHLAIVAIRMTGRLAVEIDVPDDLRRYACPPLTLATLVENAVKHGITPAADGGTISVRARRAGRILEVCVEDTGVGISPANDNLGGAGIGLANIRARLRALYRDAASLEIGANVPRGVRAVIRLPIGSRASP